MASSQDIFYPAAYGRRRRRRPCTSLLASWQLFQSQYTNGRSSLGEMEDVSMRMSPLAEPNYLPEKEGILKPEIPVYRCMLVKLVGSVYGLDEKNIISHSAYTSIHTNLRNTHCTPSNIFVYPVQNI